MNVRSSEDALGVNEEGSSERDALLLEVNTVGLGQLVASVGVLVQSQPNARGQRGGERGGRHSTYHGELQVRAETALPSVHLRPGEMRLDQVSHARVFLEETTRGNRTHKLGVGRGHDQLDAQLLKVGDGLVEGEDLGGANERKVLAMSAASRVELSNAPMGGGARRRLTIG